MVTLAVRLAKHSSRIGLRVASIHGSDSSGDSSESIATNDVELAYMIPFVCLAGSLLVAIKNIAFLIEVWQQVVAWLVTGHTKEAIMSHGGAVPWDAYFILADLSRRHRFATFGIIRVANWGHCSLATCYECGVSSLIVRCWILRREFSELFVFAAEIEMVKFTEEIPKSDLDNLKNGEPFYKGRDRTEQFIGASYLSNLRMERRRQAVESMQV
ncbi:hypothetical protein ACJJTC_014095 [Scirpophaga incertulas]